MALGTSCNSGTVSQTPCTAPGPGTCNITFTAVSPTTCLAAGGITVSGSNTNIATTAVAFTIAGYYVFALSNPNSSTDPQVVDTSDLPQSEWGGFGTSVPAAQSLTNGFTNTNAIKLANITGAALNCYNSTRGNAAAGTWYLPAICQMGGPGQNAGCANNENTTIDNLLQLGFLNINGSYWSSTENSDFPALVAWDQGFAPGGGSTQVGDVKNTPHSVRCSRALNP